MFLRLYIPGKMNIKGQRDVLLLSPKALQDLKLAKVTVKKSAKKLVIKATLKGKKPISGKKLTFKFNEILIKIPAVISVETDRLILNSVF